MYKLGLFFCSLITAGVARISKMLSYSFALFAVAAFSITNALPNTLSAYSTKEIVVDASSVVGQLKNLQGEMTVTSLSGYHKADYP